MTDAQALSALNQHLSSAVAISTWLENRPGAGPEGAPYDKLGSELRGALSQLSHLSTGPGSRPGDLNVTCERRETRREPVIVLPPIRPLENASALQGHVQMRPSTAGARRV
ncbi:uncharacterized protein EI90DRAFT_620423 [Cantharellus anzutake]|uniref:uncharacterized protein n=1 Tax=Cantharellus anzutake TaxID=1750568 RepID=UPI001903F34A|nr:uncharacterized protein EI90DRAFT_620423 [Cantharellus anzutake]KAF8333053.1 hypothetical protein EI90DRAFT_620423 [Cantharellus anzutake]